MLVVVATLICLGAIGGGLFAAGIVLSMSVLIAVGITLLVVSILGMIMNYAFSRPVVVHNPLPVSVSYSTNNMNTMKRNKSDTDLELINRQTAAAEEGNLI